MTGSCQGDEKVRGQMVKVVWAVKLLLQVTAWRVTEERVVVKGLLEGESQMGSRALGRPMILGV